MFYGVVINPDTRQIDHERPGILRENSEAKSINSTNDPLKGLQ
jgi:hypothetical protein